MARSRLKATGRRDNGPYVKLPKHIFCSDEYTRLSAAAVKLLLDLYLQFNGRNNGDLSAAWTKMNKLGWRSKGTLYAARKELLDGGWIVVSRQGGRHKASLYAVTFLAIDDCKDDLDIAPTIVPLNHWRRFNLDKCGPHAGHISTESVPIAGKKHATRH